MLSDLLTSKSFKPSNQTKDASTGTEGNVGGGTFITPASLVTFAGATFAIKILMQVIIKLAGLQEGDARLLWIAFIVSIIVGTGIVYLTLTVPGGRPTNRHQWVGAIMVAIINTAYLYLAAIGISLADSVPASDN
jgi:hypothetical protein